MQFITYLLLIFAVSIRLLPHPANFTPLAAIAIFGAIYLPKRLALVLPIAAMLISDAFIGFYNAPIMIAVYSGFVVTYLIGLYIRKNKKITTILGGTLLSSIIFYILTNAAVWAFGTMYSRDINGLFTSYYMALPFFRNSLAGDIFYTTVLISITELAIRYKQNAGLKKAL